MSRQKRTYSKTKKQVAEFLFGHSNFQNKQIAEALDVELGTIPSWKQDYKRKITEGKTFSVEIRFDGGALYISTVDHCKDRFEAERKARAEVIDLLGKPAEDRIESIDVTKLED